MECNVCKGTRGVAEMTDGRTPVQLCDGCRPLVVSLFHIHGSLTTAVWEAAKAKGGAEATRPLPDEPMMQVEALKRVVAELTSKIQLLVEWLDDQHLLPDHAFTFPDGDVWKAQDEEPGN